MIWVKTLALTISVSLLSERGSRSFFIPLVEEAYKAKVQVVWCGMIESFRLLDIAIKHNYNCDLCNFLHLVYN